ncbi:uncharacterized protein [Notamacropus eugenii]|uniref:uncharacterized protein n=1 Tax=Notamacropus eugenii TaxID=9315 RepID=UPI003B66D985
MGKTVRTFPKTLVLVPPKNVSYQTQSVLIPCPPHRIAPLSQFGPVFHQAEADQMVCLKQQVIINKSSQVPDSDHQEKAVSPVNKNTDKLIQQNNLESHLNLLFRNVPYTGDLHPGDHLTNKFGNLRSHGNKIRDLDGPAVSSHKATAESSLSPSEEKKVTSQLRGKKLNKATVTTTYNPDAWSKGTTTERQSPILNPVARDQVWKRSYSDHQDKHNLASNEQANLKVSSQHQDNIQLNPEDRSTRLLNGHRKIPALSPETKAKKQLNKRSWAKFFHDCDHQATIPLSQQHQAQVGLDLVSEDSLPLNHTHVKSEGPMHRNMICVCQRKSPPFVFQQPSTTPCRVCSTRPQLIKSSSDCWTTVTLPMLEHHSKSPFHPNVQDIPVPKKVALHLAEAPRNQYYQARATQISDHQDKEHHQIQTEQNRGILRCLHDIKPYTSERLTHTTKFVDDIISSIPKEKIKSDFSNPGHLWQMKEYPSRTCWPSQHMSANDNSCLVSSSWIPNGSPRVDRKVTVPTPSRGPEKKSVRFLLEGPQSKASPSSKAPGALSSKRRLVHPSRAFPSWYSEPTRLDPLRPKLTWLDFIRYKHHQPKEKKTPPSQNLFGEEISFTNQNIINEMSMRQNTSPVSLLKKFERRINN